MDGKEMGGLIFSFGSKREKENEMIIWGRRKNQIQFSSSPQTKGDLHMLEGHFIFLS